MELQVYIIPLRKWWWLILISTLLAAGASYLATRQQVLLYEARATLMIGRVIENPNPTNTQLTLGQQLAPAYADIARRQPVRTATMEALELSTLPDFTVQALPNTQLLEIVVVDTSPERSYVVANELANQLIRLSPSGLQEDELERQNFVNAQLDALQAQIEATQAEIELKQQELGELFSAQQITETENQLAALQGKLGTLQNNYADLLSGTPQEALNALTIIEPARLPRQPLDPNTEVTILTAAAIGFAIATAAAYTLEYLDDRVKSADAIKQTHGLATLAGITTIKKKEAENGLITVADPRSPTSEAFRALRTNLQYANDSEKTSTILITSPGQGEGKSLVAANLAIVLAQGGHSVLLIDADLHRPRQDTIFGLAQKKGLSTLLLPAPSRSNNGKSRPSGCEPTHIAKHIHSPKLPQIRLSLLPSGPVPPVPVELLGSPQMRELLDCLSVEFDFIVLDTPPVLAVTDAAVLSTMVDTVLLVVDTRRTRRSQLKHAVEHLQEVGASVGGVILNRLRHNSAEHSYPYYHLQKSYLQQTSNRKKAAAVPGKNGQAVGEKQHPLTYLFNHSLNRSSSSSANSLPKMSEQKEEE